VGDEERPVPHDAREARQDLEPEEPDEEPEEPEEPDESELEEPLDPLDPLVPVEDELELLSEVEDVPAPEEEDPLPASGEGFFA